jgi:bacterial/archaeal transporter family protein
MNWQSWAILSAVFAGLTAILAKVGVKDVDSNLATAIRTSVILVFAWTVAWMSNRQPLESLTTRTWLYLAMSGLATGASWLCYFRALQLGEASKVAPVDKLSVVVRHGARRDLPGRIADLGSLPRRNPHCRRRGHPRLCLRSNRGVCTHLITSRCLESVVCAKESDSSTYAKCAGLPIMEGVWIFAQISGAYHERRQSILAQFSYLPVDLEE